MNRSIFFSILAAWALAGASACGSSPGDAGQEPPPSDGTSDGGVLPVADAGDGEEPADAGGPVDAPDSGASPAPDAGAPVGAPDSGPPAPPDAGPPDAGPPDAGPPPPRGVTVAGNQLLKDGVPFQIRGVNRSGTEYACVQSGGLFDGPSDDASLDAIAAWGANAVRIPMNETCWLGINGVAPRASGAAYREAILGYVQRIEAHGLTPILDLHWTAPGGAQATDQMPMPDADHAPDFWREVAAAVADDPYVVLELFNEPWPDYNQDTDAAWRCWRDGGTCPGIAYEAAGMQQLVDAVRGAGAENVLLLGGIRFASTLSQWLTYEPVDPLGQLGAAWHVYSIGFCRDVACYDGSPADVAAAVPIVATEIGEDDCNGGFITTLMDWLDAHGGGYLAWTWNTWGHCMVLVDDYAGTPHGTYGTTYRDHLRARAH